MFVCAPVRDNGFQVVGALALRIRPGCRVRVDPIPEGASRKHDSSIARHEFRDQSSSLAQNHVGIGAADREHAHRKIES